MSTGLEKRINVDIICRYDNYNLRIQYVEKYFVNKGAKVRIITGDYNHITKSKADYKFHYDNIKYIHLKPYKSNISMGRIIADIEFSKKAVRDIKKRNPDIIYAVIPPNSLIRELDNYKKRHPSKTVIYDIFDLWPESFPNKMISNNIFWKNLRDKHITSADHVFVECELYKQFLSRYVGKDKISNLYLTKKYIPIKREYPQGEKINLLYLGSINTIIDIDTMMVFLTKLSSKVDICLHIIGDGSRRVEFIDKLKEKDIDFKYYGIVYEEEVKKRIYSVCHFALNIYRNGVKIGLTMKSLDYFQNGIPVISMNIYDTERLIRKYKCGYCLKQNDMDSLINSISNISKEEWLILSKNAVQLMRECFSEKSFEKSFMDKVNKFI